MHPPTGADDDMRCLTPSNADCDGPHYGSASPLGVESEHMRYEYEDGDSVRVVVPSSTCNTSFGPTPTVQCAHNTAASLATAQLGASCHIPGLTFLFQGFLGSRSATVLFDTGASWSFVSQEWLESGMKRHAQHGSESIYD